MVAPYVHPFVLKNLEPKMHIFCMQLLQWLRCLIIYYEDEPDGFKYKYKFQASEATSHTVSLLLEDLIEDFLEIFKELSKFGHDETKFLEILSDCPSEEGGRALFAMWGLTMDQGLRIVGRMAVPALANHLGNTVPDLLEMTYVGILDDDDDSDNDSVRTTIRAT